MNGAVGNLRQPFIMRYNNECLSQTVAQIKKQLMQLLLIMRIQTSGRFICQHYRRMINQCTGNCHTLFLTTRQFIGFMRGAFRQSHELQYFVSGRLCFLLPHTGNKSRYHHILQSSELRQ